MKLRLPVTTSKYAYALTLCACLVTYGLARLLDITSVHAYLAMMLVAVVLVGWLGRPIVVISEESLHIRAHGYFARSRSMPRSQPLSVELHHTAVGLVVALSALDGPLLLGPFGFYSPTRLPRSIETLKAALVAP